MENELQNTGNNSCISCLGWRWHGGKNDFMPRCSSSQRSVASAWGEKCKQVVSGVRGVCDDVTCPFLHSGVVQILKAGQVRTNDPFCCPNSPLQSSYIWFAGWPKPYSYRRAQNRLDNSWVKLCHVHLWQVELFQLTKEVQPLLSWVNVSVPLQVLRDGGSQEPEWLHCSHSAVHDDEWEECRGGSSWSLLSSPQFWACWAPDCCDCTRQPAAQPLVCKQTRHRPGWDRWLWCHLQSSGVW